MFAMLSFREHVASYTLGRHASRTIEDVTVINMSSRLTRQNRKERKEGFYSLLNRGSVALIPFIAI